MIARRVRAGAVCLVLASAAVLAKASAADAGGRGDAAISGALNAVAVTRAGAGAVGQAADGFRTLIVRRTGPSP